MALGEFFPWAQLKALERARKARGKDEHGYRAEFVHLIESADLLARR